MQTYTFPWMNGGQPFTFSRDNVTPHATKASTAHKVASKKEHLRDMDKMGLTPLGAQSLLADVETEASLAQAQALLFWTLYTIDGKVKDLGMEKVMQGMSLKQFEEMLAVLKPDDVKGDKAPLGMTSRSSASTPP